MIGISTPWVMFVEVFIKVKTVGTYTDALNPWLVKG